MSVNAKDTMRFIFNMFISVAGDIKKLGNKTLASHLAEAHDIRQELKRAEKSGYAARSQATWIGLER